MPEPTGVPRIHAERDQHVTEVHPGRADSDPHLARAAADLGLSGQPARHRPSCPLATMSSRQAEPAPGGGSNTRPEAIRTSRGSHTRPSRTATWSAPQPGETSGQDLVDSRAPSTSTSTNRPGCSTQRRPHQAPHRRHRPDPAPSLAGPPSTAPGVNDHQPRPGETLLGQPRRTTARTPATASPTPAPPRATGSTTVSGTVAPAIKSGDQARKTS